MLGDWRWWNNRWRALTFFWVYWVSNILHVRLNCEYSTFAWFRSTMPELRLEKKLLLYCFLWTSSLCIYPHHTMYILLFATLLGWIISFDLIKRLHIWNSFLPQYPGLARHLTHHCPDHPSTLTGLSNDAGPVWRISW
jgi:hypothetical protein